MQIRFLGRWLGVGLLAMAATGGQVFGQTDDASAAALRRVIEGTHRDPLNRARDRYRHPYETLTFFGIRENMTVVEVSPGGGWFTEILAPLVLDQGEYYWAGGIGRAARDKLAGAPEQFGKVRISLFDPGRDQWLMAPPGSADMVLTFRNIHNWMKAGSAERMFRSIHEALKPGGILGVTEHRGNPAVSQDPRALSGYVNEDYAVRLIESVGFRLVAKSEVNANPRDTKDYPDGVWTLPPTYQLKDKGKERFTAIGESDRMTLKFIKPVAAR